ncbi:MAG: hypothetical protein KIT19_10525 [Phycisphaeraceae bacterium]|nr:hypothetical protein [Phycisphaeraceae bacterium]
MRHRSHIPTVPALLALAMLTSCGQSTRPSRTQNDRDQPVTVGLAALERGESPAIRGATPDPYQQPEPGSVDELAARSALDLERVLADAATRDASRTTPTPVTRTPPPAAQPEPITQSTDAQGVSVGLVSVERTPQSAGGGPGGAAAGSQASTGLAALAGAETSERSIEGAAAEFSDLLIARAAQSPTPMGDLALAAAIAGSQGRPTPNVGTIAPTERAVLDAIRSIHQSIATSNSEGSPSIDHADALRAAADRASEGLPLRITDARLCTRVNGFGDYNELNVNSFLAGRPARVIVYTEVDRFANRPGPGVRRTVELSQEIDVYHDSDGAHCWKRPAQSISESSRTKRRDFFITNAIELPSTLTVGKYRMKITMRDLTSNSVAETTIPFTIVADAKLAHTSD